jgi:hypothetical protein
MPFDREGGGHAFDLISKKCGRCGMTREAYEDHGKPRCPGRPRLRQDEVRDLTPLRDDPLGEG